MVEEHKSEGCLGSIKHCWEPPIADELRTLRNRLIDLTVAVADMYRVNPTDITNGHQLPDLGVQTGAIRDMAKLNSQPQVFEGCWLEGTTIPSLIYGKKIVIYVLKVQDSPPLGATAAIRDALGCR